MPSDNLKELFKSFGLEEHLIRISNTSPYALSVLEKYPADISRLLSDDFWKSPLDYSQYDVTSSPLLLAIKSVSSDQECKRLICQFRNIHSARILWHDLNGLADWQSVFKAQADLADICIRSVLEYLEKDFSQKYVPPAYKDGRPMQLAIIAMGKWGGIELNFSSDIDFILVYSENGEAQGKDGRRDIEYYQYFTKLSQRLIQILDDVGSDGFVYRCDTRLRPFGDSGALVLSLAAMEQYLTQHGREWERYAYLKARCVTGDSAVISDFEALRRPFVYRRYLDYGVFSKLRKMHQQIAEQVRKKELIGNLKLGLGGIRECEFLVQAIQLLRGGRQTSLQQANFYQAYAALLSEGALPEIDSSLLDAYIFLRILENRLQSIHQQQTHQLPENENDRAYLICAMNFDSWSELVNELESHKNTVHALFKQQISLLGTEPDDEKTAKNTWQQAILKINLPDTAKEFFFNLEKSRHYKRLTEDSQESLDNLLLNLLEELYEYINKKSESEIISATQNIFDVIYAIGRRAIYYDLLIERPAALKHLLDVSFTSDYLCAQIAQRPILLDELLDARIFTQLPTRVDLELAIQSLIRNSSGSDSEDFINDLVVYKHVQSFQIATAEIFKRLPLMKVSDRLSDLAELLLEAVYTRVLGQAFEKFELPHLEEFETGFSILAYGKLGGLELSYSSDLDVVFLYNSDELPKSHILASDTSLQLKFYSYLVQQCLRYIDMPTSMGRLYEIDTRLRPSGNSGFLISSLSAFETYQSEEAWVWEHQALSRARVVLGSQISRDAISTIRKKILTTKINHATLKQDVLEMRERIREQYLKKNPANDLFHLKHSKGGMIDLEFLVQYLVLDNAQDFPEVIEFSDNIRQLEELARVGCLSKKTTLDLISAYIQIREQAHLQTLQDKKPLILKSDIKIAQDIVSKAWQQVFA